MSDALTQGLNPQQKKAVTVGSGPTLVLAGPGSGKTGVLTRRIAYLINVVQADPRSIMAVTFTNKAAGEMNERVARYLGRHVRGLSVGTFHATCARILRIEHDHLPHHNTNFVIYDTDDQLRLIQQAVDGLQLDNQKIKPRSLLNLISAAKNELITPETFVSQDYLSEVAARVYPRYRDLLQASNAMDFDDLLLETTTLMRDNPDVQEKYQRRYDFVLVDEFQDTNIAQYELVKLFAAPQNNVFVVGDEDQSIYAFRGADYRNIMRFRQDYPQAEVVLLEQNYRSTQVVLDVARAVINRNRNRTPKALFTERTDGDPIEIIEAYDEDNEARTIMQTIEDLQAQEGYTLGDMAIMYRTNVQSRALESALRRYSIPYTLVGGVGFYQRLEVRDLLSYLRVIQNVNDQVSFERATSRPKRGIGKKTLTNFQNWARDIKVTQAQALDILVQGKANPLSARAAKGLAGFELQRRKWERMAQPGNLTQLLDTVMSDINFFLYLDGSSNNRNQLIERQENVNELRGLLQRADEDDIPLAEFIGDQMLMTDVQTNASQREQEQERVTLLTLHAAKGLEYPVVFLTGLEEGLLPHQRSFDEEGGVDEERRLFYVGLTRAKDRLYLSYAFRRNVGGGSREPSGFLYDIPRDLVASYPDELLVRVDQMRSSDQGLWHNDTSEKPTLAKPDFKPVLRSKTSQQPRRTNSKIVPFPGNENKNKDKETRETEFEPGQIVKHPVFGQGVVMSSKLSEFDEEVSVAFRDRRYGRKTVMASVANLTIDKQ